MFWTRCSGRVAAFAATQTEGKLMGLLDGVLGGIVGAGLATAVGGLIEKHGGVQGLVNEMETKGLGPAVQSWVGLGPNQPVSAAQVYSAIGPELMSELAAKVGLTPQDLAEKLALVLPQAIDKLTPNGAVPKT
jgi:uncharacterized protein YidB (DUF937 family)